MRCSELGARRIKVAPGDVLIIEGLDISADALRTIILSPEKRLLWAFVKNGEHDIQPIAYDEHRVVWLSEEDLIRSENDPIYS